VTEHKRTTPDVAEVDQVEIPTLSFKFDGRGELRPRQDGNVILIDLFFGKHGEELLPISGAGGSVSFFKNAQQVAAWCDRAQDIFGEGFQDAIKIALIVLLNDASSLALVEQSLSPFDKEAILRDHLAFAEKLIRRQLKMDAGRPRQWTAIELSVVIDQVMRQLKPRERNYDGVAKKLQEVQPQRAPASGESLRKLVKFYRVNWKRIKQGVERGDK
jgi:hypothetical protein